MAQTTVSDREVRTDDLALATTLRCENFEPRRLELENRNGNRVGVWIFSSNREICEVVNDYRRGNALVEPLEYNRCLRDTRRQLFNFLRSHGVTPKPSARV